MNIEEMEARKRAATTTELLPHIREEELKRMHGYDAYYFARELNEAWEKLEEVEAVGVPHSIIISIGGAVAHKCYHWCYACAIDRILHPKEANDGQA